jgi:hypothetical protein
MKPASQASSLTPRLFGAFEAHLGDTPLPQLRTRKAQRLLALLAQHPGAEVARDWLAGTLWPDSPKAAAPAHLRGVLQDLRRALGPEAHRLRPPTTRTLCLDLAGAWVDVASSMRRSGPAASAVADVTSPGFCGREITDQTPAARPIAGQPRNAHSANRQPRVHRCIPR